MREPSGLPALDAVEAQMDPGTETGPQPSVRDGWPSGSESHPLPRMDHMRYGPVL